MKGKSFKAPSGLALPKSGKMKGHKGSGGFKGRVKQSGPKKPVTKKTNP